MIEQDACICHRPSCDGVATGRRGQRGTSGRKLLIWRECNLRLPAGQTGKGDGSSRQGGRFGNSWRGGTRCTAGRNPAWRGEFGQKEGPGDHPSPCRWWRWRESNSRPEDLYSRDYMLSHVIWISFPCRRRTGCRETSHLALALHPSDPDGRDRSKCPRCDFRCYPVAARAERRPVRGPAGLSRQSVRFVVRS